MQVAELSKFYILGGIHVDFRIDFLHFNGILQLLVTGKYHEFLQ